MNSVWTVYESPLGRLTLIGGPAGLAALHFPGRSAPLDEARRRAEPFAVAVAQLEAYFAGERTVFDLALDPRGTSFQRRVWAQLHRIPFGETLGYERLADAVGRPDRVRAVAAAVGSTPIPIIIPCHRVLGATGELVRCPWSPRRTHFEASQATRSTSRASSTRSTIPSCWSVTPTGRRDLRGGCGGRQCRAPRPEALRARAGCVLGTPPCSSDTPGAS